MVVILRALAISIAIADPVEGSQWPKRDVVCSGLHQPKVDNVGWLDPVGIATAIADTAGRSQWPREDVVWSGLRQPKADIAGWLTTTTIIITELVEGWMIPVIPG